MKKDVWNQISLSPSFNIHFVFVDSKKLKSLKVTKIFESVNKFAAIFAESFRLSLSFEHFLDFSLENFMDNLWSKELTKKNLIASDGLLIDNRHIPALATEIDRLSTSPINPDPLLKIAVFVENSQKIYFIDENLVKNLQN